MTKQHGVYKYVTIDTNEIIYIGKTNNSFISRIDNHNRGYGIDEKFNAYKDNYKVYIAHLPNATETEIVERALINKYKPILNVIDNYDGFSSLIHVEEPKWQEYNLEKNTKKKEKCNRWKELSELNSNELWMLLAGFQLSENTKVRNAQLSIAIEIKKEIDKRITNEYKK